MSENALNIRHGLDPATIRAFRMLADLEGMTHGELLTRMVAERMVAKRGELERMVDVAADEAVASGMVIGLRRKGIR